ncbi:MAG: metallophosphoesterase [Polyangiales bacterium]
MQTIVIGDVHGCADELAALLRACGHGSNDEVVLVGDLVAKGPDSRGVLAIVREVAARAVCGNHDARVLSWKRAIEQGRPPPRLGKSHQEVVEVLDARDFALLAALPLFLRLPQHGAIVVHAGVMPGVALEDQDPDLLMNMRTIRPDGTGSRSPDDGPLWGSLWPGPELVLFGHHAMRGLQEHPFALGLDTGCVYGGRLTACILPERRLVSVPARRAYAPVDEERR